MNNTSKFLRKFIRKPYFSLPFVNILYELAVQNSPIISILIYIHNNSPGIKSVMHHSKERQIFNLELIF